MSGEAEWSEKAGAGAGLTFVDRTVKKLGLSVGFASALALGTSTLVWVAFSAAIFGHGLGARFPLCLLAAQAVIALLGFGIGAPLNRGPPTLLSLRLLQTLLPSALFHALSAWGGACVLGKYGVVSYAAARCFAALLTLVLEGIVLHEPVARLVVCSSLLLVIGGVIAAAAERSMVEAGTGAALGATVHALCGAAFLVATRAAAVPPGTTAKARAIAITLISLLLFALAAGALELLPLLATPSKTVSHLAVPLVLSGAASAYWHVAAQWCVAETSAGTAGLTTAYSILPAIPLATLALRGSHAAASASAAATAVGAANATAGAKPEGGSAADGAAADLSASLGLPAGLAKRGFVSSVGVVLMVVACGCFSYSKERQRRIEAMLGAADLEDMDEPGETAGLVAALTADTD